MWGPVSISHDPRICLKERNYTLALASFSRVVSLHSIGILLVGFWLSADRQSLSVSFLSKRAIFQAILDRGFTFFGSECYKSGWKGAQGHDCRLHLVCRYRKWDGGRSLLLCLFFLSASLFEQWESQTRRFWFFCFASCITPSIESNPLFSRLHDFGLFGTLTQVLLASLQLFLVSIQQQALQNRYCKCFVWHNV